MRFLTLCATALIFSLCIGEQAEARRGGGASGTAEQLSLITETQLTNDQGQLLSLCHLTENRHVLFLPVWRSSLGYAMAINKCDAESYYPVDAEKLTLGKVLGELPEDLPDQPKLSVSDMISGFWGLGVFALLLGVAGIKWAGRSARTSKRKAEMKGAAPAAVKAIDAMCHAAKADGRLDDSEIALMSDIAKQMTGEPFDEARIRRMYDLAEAKPTEHQFASFGSGLSPDQKRMVLQAVLMIIGSDGDLDKRETDFVQKLAHGLKISGAEVKALFQSMYAKPAEA
ncbi:Uncharacterized conserved protein, tellurite resistance protein B (TerB) family [Ruegeria halocynthiae]|uniref:Uncharacterized conserved protein, tellurite resistance protein B (TerB) family n=1 Tax=Ruegeria halocynthiae TaxID=985054 RepID=A0A1H2Z9U5_9RHOB|nr:DUF533 domain-containing protein [Ruegeria halocynthiae]SDX14097.1 Uncharacterized conserved protein, tellurite resistance protein B (TerB) family [Ruegeria halocynthiae]